MMHEMAGALETLPPNKRQMIKKSGTTADAFLGCGSAVVQGNGEKMMRLGKIGPPLDHLAIGGNRLVELTPREERLVDALKTVHRRWLRFMPGVVSQIDDARDGGGAGNATTQQTTND